MENAPANLYSAEGNTALQGDGDEKNGLCPPAADQTHMPSRARLWKPHPNALVTGGEALRG